MNSKLNKLALALGALAIAGGAMASDSGATTMGASASITAECSVGNVTPLAFGALAMLSNGSASTSASASTGGGTFDAICTSGATTPKLRFTSANTDTVANFRLRGADTTTLIAYTLAESGSAVIAAGADAAFTGFTADGTVKSLTIKGSIASGEKTGKAAQIYSDTITITSSFTP
jgi:spore coat protein U-like protein